MDANSFGQLPNRPPGRGPRPEEDVAHRQALRLTFRFRKTVVELVLMEPIDMVVPPSLDLTDQPPAAEFWYELTDGRRTTLYRRVQRHPIDPNVEVTTGNPERPYARVNSGRTEGEFTLLVPHLPEAEAVVLYHWTRDAGQRDARSPTEIARVPLGRAIDPEAIARDRIPPRTVSDAVAAYVGAATIHLRADDNLGQVAGTFYRLDDGDAQQGLIVTVRERGEHSLRFWSVDRTGNAEPENRVTFTVGASAGAA